MQKVTDKTEVVENPPVKPPLPKKRVLPRMALETKPTPPPHAVARLKCKICGKVEPKLGRECYKSGKFVTVEEST